MWPMIALKLNAYLGLRSGPSSGCHSRLYWYFPFTVTFFSFPLFLLSLGILLHSSQKDFSCHSLYTNSLISLDCLCYIKKLSGNLGDKKSLLFSPLELVDIVIKSRLLVFKH